MRSGRVLLASALGLLLGCGRPAAVRPAPRVGDACFAAAAAPEIVWRARQAASGAQPTTAREALPFVIDATHFAAPVRLELRVLADAVAADTQSTAILLTVAGARGESRTLPLKTDAAGCRFESATASITCFEAGAWLDFTLVQRGAAVYVTKQLGDEAEPEPGPRLPYAEIHVQSSQPLQLLELTGEAGAPDGRCTLHQVQLRSL